METGYVSLVGAGCGDAELLTIKAKKRLQCCEVLVYDSLAASEIIAQAPQGCEKIYVGKRYGRHAMKQEQIHALLIQKAREGKHVVRLKGGDPYVFGRGGEEALALQGAGIFCEEIPGISAAIAVPAAAGIPVTHRGLARSVTVLTGTAAGEDGREVLSMDFAVLARLEGTLVILMGMHHLERIATGLMEAGKDAATPCAVIMEGTTAAQKSVRAPLCRIAQRAVRAGLSSPAVIVVGAVAGLRLCGNTDAGQGGFPFGFAGEADRLPMGPERADLPLRGIRVGVTGTPRFFKKLSGMLLKQGASVQDMSFLEIRENPAPLPALSSYSWLVFTSPNGVRVFLDKMKRERRDLRELSAHRLAVIGPGTEAALEEAGLYGDFMPPVYDAAHLAEGLTALLRAGKKDGDAGSGMEMIGEPMQKPVLFLRARQGSDALPTGFARQGLAYTDFSLYDVCVNEEKREQTGEADVDYLVFGAGSGVRAYFAGREREASAFTGRYVCMGEACGRELARFTDAAFLTAVPSSVEGIVDCICQDRKERM